MDDTQAIPPTEQDGAATTTEGPPGPSRPSAAATEAAEMFAAPVADAPDDGDQTLLTWRLLGGVGLALALIAVLAWKVTGTSTTSAGDDAASAVADGAGPTGMVRDDFGRSSSDSLGQATTGQSWQALTGVWGTADGTAEVVRPNQDGGGRSLAVVDLGSPHGSVAATVATPEAGWGLVFRLKGPADYWMVTASPKFGTYNLVKVEKGKATPAGNTGLSKQEPGTTVAVEFQGSTITVLINGARVKTIDDPANANGTKVGLVLADATGGDARWSEFSARKLSATPSVPAGPGSATPGTTAATGAPVAGSDG